MADFKKTMELIQKYEGNEYVNDPHDYGGETKCGIAKRFHQDVDIKNLVWDDPAPEGKVSALPIYRKDYWDKICGDGITDQDLANSMMDIAVNIGWKEAGRWVQHAFNELIVSIDPDSPDTLTEDGLVGPASIKSINSYKRPWEIMKMLEGFQFSHYMRRIQEDETQRKFLRSWLMRIDTRRTV